MVARAVGLDAVGLWQGTWAVGLGVVGLRQGTWAVGLGAVGLRQGTGAVGPGTVGLSLGAGDVGPGAVGLRLGAWWVELGVVGLRQGAGAGGSAGAVGLRQMVSYFTCSGSACGQYRDLLTRGGAQQALTEKSKYKSFSYRGCLGVIILG